jgi:hypothetical protein
VVDVKVTELPEQKVVKPGEIDIDAKGSGLTVTINCCGIPGHPRKPGVIM